MDDYHFKSNWLINCHLVAIKSHWRATLEKGPRSKVQCNRAILLDESHKLDPWPLDESPRLKSDKSRLNLHGTILERTKMQARVQGKVQLKGSICFKWVQIGPLLREPKRLKLLIQSIRTSPHFPTRNYNYKIPIIIIIIMFNVQCSHLSISRSSL